MHNELNDATINTPASAAKAAWKRPTIGYIDIKRTMSTPGGSLSDQFINSPGGSITATN